MVFKMLDTIEEHFYYFLLLELLNLKNDHKRNYKTILSKKRRTREPQWFLYTINHNGLAVI